MDYSNLSGATAYDKDGKKVGEIDTLYYDEDSKAPTWATVKSSSLFGSKLHFAPLAGAQQTDDGIAFAADSDHIKNAPSVEVDEELSEEDERTLYEHYAMTDSESDSEGSGHDTSGPDTDDAMTRSEEQLEVGKQQTEAGRMRLKKYIVTEEVHTTVPVSHEEVRLEREPITDANHDQAMDGGDLTEEEHEMTLNKEEVVVSKKTVPVERVKLGKTTVTEQQDVNETLRKEQIDLEDDVK